MSGPVKRPPDRMGGARILGVPSGGLDLAEMKRRRRIDREQRQARRNARAMIDEARRKEATRRAMKGVVGT